MNDRTGIQHHDSAQARALHVRPGVGAAAHVLQGRGLEILRMRSELPALIVVERARQALASAASIPEAVARQRMLEAMHWLLEAGIVLHAPAAMPSVAVKLRALIAGRLDGAWTGARVAAELAVSEATLRRRLAAEGTSLQDVLVEARMATALTLLQATAQPVSDIARAVGYASPSRFAVRFRQRFGFAPTAVRGQERTI